MAGTSIDIEPDDQRINKVLVRLNRAFPMPVGMNRQRRRIEALFVSTRGVGGRPELLGRVPVPWPSYHYKHVRHIHDNRTRCQAHHQ